MWGDNPFTDVKSNHWYHDAVKYTYEKGIFAGNNAPVGIQKFGYCYERPGVPEKGVPEGFVSDHFAIFTQVEV